MIKITKDIRLKGDQKITLFNIINTGKHLDGLFQFYSCAFPTLIIEIGWAQKKLHIIEKMYYYFKISQGDIRTVIYINLNNIYRKQRAVEKK